MHPLKSVPFKNNWKTLPGDVHFAPVIAFPKFFARKPQTPRQLRLPRPVAFILVRGADEERIDAEYDESGTVMRRLVVFTKTPPVKKTRRRKKTFPRA